MNWQRDAVTAQVAAANVLPLVAHVPAPQSDGRDFNPGNWNHRTLQQQWPAVHPLRSSPDNIIALFHREAFLEALAMVISWGTMWRHPDAIYGNRGLIHIQQTLQHCAQLIQRTHSIQAAWEALTGTGAHQLRWSPVLASKTLHFLARSLGFHQNPPVPLDNAIILNHVWPAFIALIPNDVQRPDGWRGNSFAAYSRYMTAILVWAAQRHWTTTEMEATIFDEY